MSNAKPVLTSLLINLVDENARQASCLKTIRALVQIRKERNVDIIGWHELEAILEAHGISTEKEINIPEFMRQYKKEYADEDEA